MENNEIHKCPKELPVELSSKITKIAQKWLDSEIRPIISDDVLRMCRTIKRQRCLKCIRLNIS